MNRARNQRGQVFVLTAVCLTVITGMAALVMDVGAWFRAQRDMQATADAAALAGAQGLPNSISNARGLALTYAGQNGGGVAAGDVTFTGSNTISVRAKKQHPGFFSKIFGVDLVDISAKASARVGVPMQARYVAPMVVFCDHPLIQNCDDTTKMPTFEKQTTLDFDPMGAPGAFGMLNLDGQSGTVGTSKEAAWILKGFDKYLPLGIYRSDPGAKFSAQEIRGALDDRITSGVPLLFPVFRTLDGQGQQAEYDIIGWIGFRLQSYQSEGNNATLTGYFTEFIAQGILTGSGGPGSSNFGVKSIQLID